MSIYKSIHAIDCFNLVALRYTIGLLCFEGLLPTHHDPLTMQSVIHESKHRLSQMSPDARTAHIF